MSSSDDMSTLERSSSSQSFDISDREDSLDTEDNKEIKSKNMKRNKRDILRVKVNADIAKHTRRHSATPKPKKLHEEEQLVYRNYSSIKVYSISNASSRERLLRKIAQSKSSKDFVQIDWESIMA